MGAETVTLSGANGEDFSSSFLALQEAVRAACQSRSRWEGKVVAGIQATLEFAAADPGQAKALTIHARRPAFGRQNPEQVVLAHFVDLLGSVAPAARRLPVSTDEAVVESIASIVRGHLLAGTAEQLPDAAPDLVYLTLLPYLGLQGTRRWAQPLSRVNG